MIFVLVAVLAKYVPGMCVQKAKGIDVIRRGILPRLMKRNCVVVVVVVVVLLHVDLQGCDDCSLIIKEARRVKLVRLLRIAVVGATPHHGRRNGGRD